jgi:hypothetical protein
MSYDSISSPSPYRPYVVPLDPSPSILNSSKSSPRDLLADLDIPTDYLETPEFSDMLTNLLTKGLSKYASIFIRQPFEIVKTTMQVQYLGRPVPTIFPLPTTRRGRSESDEDDVLLPFCWGGLMRVRMFLIQVRIHLCFQGVVLRRREVRVSCREGGRVEGGDNMCRIHLCRRYNRGNYLVMLREFVLFSTQYGQKKVHGGYGRVRTPKNPGLRMVN